MHVCMCASQTIVSWKPLTTFPSKFDTMILSWNLKKKKLMGTELRRTFYFAQRCAQWAKNSGAFWKKNSFVFSEKKSKMKHCHLYFTKNPLPVKSLVLKSCVKMLLANQIEGFFKVQYLKKKLWDQENFLYVNKNQSFLQGNTVFLAWVVRHA